MAIKAYANNVEAYLDGIKVIGRLMPIRAPKAKETALRLCTPEGKPVRQVYINDETGELYEKDELGRAREEDGELVPVPIDEVIEAKQSELPKNEINLTVHRTDDVERYLFPSDNNAYVFEPVRKNEKNKIVPDPLNVQMHDLVNVMIRENPDITLLGEMNLQGHEGLFRLGLYHGKISFQRQLYPEDLNQYDFVAPSLEPEVRGMAAEKAHRLISGFEPERYRNMISARLSAIESGSIGEIGAVAKMKPASQEVDMKEYLRSILSS